MGREKHVCSILRCSSAVSMSPALIQCKAIKKTQQTKLLTLHGGKTVSHAAGQRVAPFPERKRNRRQGQESNLFCRVVVIGAMLRQLVVGLIERLQLLLSLLAFLVRHPGGNTTNGAELTDCRGKAFVCVAYSPSTHLSLCLLRIICVALSASAICSFLVTISSTDA